MKHGEGNDGNKIKFKGTPRDIGGDHTAAIQTGTDGYTYLAGEKYFTKYWHLLTSDKYDTCNIMEQIYNHTKDNVPEVHATNLKNAYTQLKTKAEALYTKAGELTTASALKNALQGAVGADDQAGQTGTPKDLLQALKQLDTTPSGDTAKKVFEKFNAVVDAYNALTDQDRVKTQFEALQAEYSNAIYQYKFHFLTIPSLCINGQLGCPSPKGL